MTRLPDAHLSTWGESGVIDFHERLVAVSPAVFAIVADLIKQSLAIATVLDSHRNLLTDLSTMRWS